MTTHHQRIATTWAAQVLTAAGCTLHAVPGGWDVEHADGSWTSCNSWQDLCRAARMVTPS